MWIGGNIKISKFKEKVCCEFMWRSGGIYCGVVGNKIVGKINFIFGGVYVVYCFKGNRKMFRVVFMEFLVWIGFDIIVLLFVKNVMFGGGENVFCYSLDYFKIVELFLFWSFLFLGG